MADLTGYSEEFVDRLRRARHIAVLSGAGVSAESGIPTFRDKLVGLWENFDPAELATSAAFRRDPALVWGWYEWRRMTVLRAQPNAAHRALAAMADLIPKLTLITQNVDDLHERAGSRGVLHLHGRLAAPYCEACRQPYVFSASIPNLPPGGTRIEPPRCSHCGGQIRPGVVWFGENLPSSEWQAAMDAAKSCDAFLCVGTSSIVQPAASLTEMAIRAGAITIQINPNATGADDVVSFSLKGPAGEILPQLLNTAWGFAHTAALAVKEPEVIVRVLAEVGSITLLGQQNPGGGWRYARAVGDQTLALLEEKERGGAIHSVTDWVTEWSEAIALLNEYPWVMLAAVEVHPEFSEPLWEEVVQRLAGKASARAESARQRWRRLFRIERSGK